MNMYQSSFYMRVNTTGALYENTRHDTQSKMVIYKFGQPLCDSWQRLTLSLALSSDTGLSLWVGSSKSDAKDIIFQDLQQILFGNHHITDGHRGVRHRLLTNALTQILFNKNITLVPSG